MSNRPAVGVIERGAQRGKIPTALEIENLCRWITKVELELDAALEREKALQKNLDQVDEILTVNWVGPRVDGDYRKALHDLITRCIDIENDPRVSSTAKARQDELNDLRERETYYKSIRVERTEY